MGGRGISIISMVLLACALIEIIHPKKKLTLERGVLFCRTRFQFFPIFSFLFLNTRWDAHCLLYSLLHSCAIIIFMYSVLLFKTFKDWRIAWVSNLYTS